MAKDSSNVIGQPARARRGLVQRARSIGVRAIAAVAAVGTFASAARAATPDEVDAAIGRGTRFLLNDPTFVQHGNWEDEQKSRDVRRGDSVVGDQWGGKTALCAYALLASGKSANEPALKRAVDFLRLAEIKGYYALGLRPQVWLHLPSTPENRTAAIRDYKLLWAGVEKDMSKRDGALYDYTILDRVRIDLSVSQYGVLGMWACAQLNIEVPAGDPKRNQPNFWNMVETRWRGLQDKRTGGWTYTGEAGGSPSMTAAGVATLFITQEYLHTRDGLTCSGNIKYPEIERGIDFLAKALPGLVTVGGPTDHYTLYGIERIGVASGLKYLGAIDWYRAGAEYLVRTQNANGSWSGHNGTEVSTSFALLFLSRGREPVVMNKIKYDVAGPPAAGGAARAEGFWNQRARDVANVTLYVGKQLERTLNWQIVDLGVAGVDDLHDAPIAYFSGAQALNLAAADVAKLRQYVEEGGLLVFNTDCGRRSFSKSLEKLLPQLVGSREWRPLEADSVILKDQQFKATTWRQKPDVKAISNGVREVAILLDDDAAKSWQTNEVTVRSDHYMLMADVYQYAIDKVHARVKGRTHVVRVDANVAATKPAIKVARLMVGANPDPEPGGWRRLAAIFHNALQTPLAVAAVTPGRDDLDGYHVAHLTGVGPVALSAETIAGLKKFVDAGGTLVVDAAGGDARFAASIGAQLAKINAAATAEGGELLPGGDPLFAMQAAGPLKIEYRNYRRAIGEAANVPALRATKVGGRDAIFFSADDLSAGLVGNQIDGIRGYAPDTATGIMSRILLSAKDNKTGVATPKVPATNATTRATTTRPAGTTRPAATPAAR